MGFKIRINFVDVITSGSLKNTYLNGNKSGYEFKIRLSYYRGHFLSTIKTFELFVDGKQVSNSQITFGLNGKEFFVSQLPDLSSEFWYLLDPATIKVHQVGGLPSGDHDIKLNLLLRNPYMPALNDNGERNYATLDSCGEKTLTLKEITEDK